MCTVNKCSVFKNMMIKNYLTRWSQEQVNSAQNISCQRSSQSWAKGYQNQKGRDKEKEEERSKENGLLGTHPRQSEKLLQPLLNALSFLKILFIFREGKGGRKRGRQTSMCGCLSHTPQTGTRPATQACVLTENRAGDLVLCGTMPHTLSHMGQGQMHFLCDQLQSRPNFSGKGQTHLSLQTQRDKCQDHICKSMSE